MQNLEARRDISGHKPSRHEPLEPSGYRKPQSRDASSQWNLKTISDVRRLYTTTASAPKQGPKKFEPEAAKSEPLSLCYSLRPTLVGVPAGSAGFLGPSYDEAPRLSSITATNGLLLLLLQSLSCSWGNDGKEHLHSQLPPATLRTDTGSSDPNHEAGSAATPTN